MDKSVVEYLEKIYFDTLSPASYSGIDKLYKYVKTQGIHNIPRRQIREWLESQEVYTLYKPLNRKFRRNKIITGGIDQMWELDLAFMTELKKYNKNYTYFLLVIDAFSRFAWTRPLKTKSSREVSIAFEDILKQGRRCFSARTDKGTEFTGPAMQNVFNVNHIKHFTTQNEVKAAIAERCIRTVKAILYKYFSHNQTYNWIDVLPQITSRYNNSFHRTIKMTPVQVNADNEVALWEYMYGPKKLDMKLFKDPVKFKLEIGDYVRISHTRYVFTREYHERFTVEIFIVIDRVLRSGIPIYKLKDFANENIKGTFYEQELQRVRVDSNTTYRIDKILATRGRGTRKQVLIRWTGYGPQFDSWIPHSHVIRYKKHRMR